MAVLVVAAPATTAPVVASVATAMQIMVPPVPANVEALRAQQPAPMPQPVAALAASLTPRVAPAAVGAGATTVPAAQAGQPAVVAKRRVAAATDSAPRAAPADAGAAKPEPFATSPAAGPPTSASPPASASLALALRPNAPMLMDNASTPPPIALANSSPADSRAGQLAVQSGGMATPVPGRFAMADPATPTPAPRAIVAAARRLASAEEAVVAGPPFMTAPPTEAPRAAAPPVALQPAQPQQAQPQQGPQQVEVETPALGPVTIALERAEGALRVHFTVDRGAAAQALLDSAAVLDRSLATTGTRLDQFSVDVRGSQPGMTANIDAGGERQPGRDPRQPLPQHEPPIERDVPERARRIATLDRFA